MSDNSLIQLIDENQCIGDSLPILNSNFTNLDNVVCDLTDKQNQIIYELKQSADTFTTGLMTFLNLLSGSVGIAGGRYVKSLSTPVLVYGKSPLELTGVWKCYVSEGDFTVSGLLTFTLPSEASDATYLLFRVDDSSYTTNGSYLRSISVNGVDVYTMANSVAGVSVPYTVIPRSAMYSYVFKYNGDGDGCVPPNDWGIPSNLRIVGYF